METRCRFWLPKKKRFCANAPLNDSLFCGNHTARPDGEWVPCPIDPSHCVLGENLEAHVRRCPLLKQVESLTHQPFYQKGINAGEEDDHDEIESLGVEGTGDLALSNGPVLGAVDNIVSEMKRNVVYNMTVPDFYKLVEKNESVHESLCKDIRDSYKVTEACGMWIKREVDRKLPFQEKHVMQQVSILGNSEDFGVLKNSEGERADFGDVNGVPAVVEFGAGRGCLTQMLADCYGKLFLVERKSYKLKVSFVESILFLNTPLT